MKRIIFNTKGVLKKKLQLEHKTIIILTFLTLMSVTLLQVLFEIIYNIKTYYTISIVWIILLIFIPHLIENIPFKYLRFVLLSPLLIVVNMIYGLYILRFREKYPNVSEEHVNRYRKIKKLLRV